MNNQKWKKVLYGVKLPPDILGIIKSVKNLQNERGSKKKEYKNKTKRKYTNSIPKFSVFNKLNEWKPTKESEDICNKNHSPAITVLMHSYRRDMAEVLSIKGKSLYCELNLINQSNIHTFSSS